MIQFLLLIIAFCELFRLFSLLKPQNNKDYYKSRRDKVQRDIWELEFKTFQTRQIREDVRKERDRLLSVAATLDEQIKKFPKDGNVDERKRLEDEQVRKERDIERMTEQMKRLDIEINGEKPNVDNPHGGIGLTGQIESLEEVKKMFEDYLERDLR